MPSRLDFQSRHLAELDWTLVFAVLIATLFGALAVDGSYYPEASDRAALAGEPIPWMSNSGFKQLMFWAISLPIAALSLGAHYRSTERFAWPLYAGCLLSLVFLLILQDERKGAASWFSLGPVSVQPAEFMKLATLLLLADHLRTRTGQLREWRDLLGPAAILGAPMALITLQPDFGTAMVFAPMGLAMLWVAGLRKRLLVYSLAIALLGGAMTYPFLRDYQKQRIISFFKPDAAAPGGRWNIEQAHIALGSGETFGKGWRQGTQTRWRYLPEHHTDFIFSSVGEQFGLVGMATVLGLLAIILLRMLHTARHARDWHGALIVTGVAAIFMTHAALNIGMVLQLLPVTGLPLPLFSYGGSFLLANYLAIALVLNVGMRRYESR